MKKMLAFFTAVICCFGSFTACGNKKNSSREGDSVSETAAAPENETSGAVEDESSEEFTETFRKFFGSGDPVQMMEVSLPDVVIKSMKNIGGFETISETMAVSSARAMADMQEVDISAAKYISQRECDLEMRSRLEKLYSAYYSVYKTIEDNGINYEQYISGDIDESKMKLILEALANYNKIGNSEDADIGEFVKFDDIKYVTFSMNGEQTEFLMYKISGESWKIDMIGLAVFEY